MIEASIRVLIVDDLPQVRQGLATVLRLAARRIRPTIEVIGEAQNGHEAIQLAQSLRPEVILMDVEMPGMDGYEAARRIKAEQPRARVIILTIHTGPQAQRRAREAGADGFVPKDAGYQTLLNAILGRDEKQKLQEEHKGDVR